ncbi:MAG: protein translocase SEC61 complex subunit gamma [Candidatus Pacearchaeota archaeon]
MEKIKSFFAQCRRVWTVLKKPSRQEFSSISKISAIGILALGLAGFVIGILMRIFG